MQIQTALIIDDDPVFVLGTKFLLAKGNFIKNIEVQDNGKDAMSFIQSFFIKENTLPELIFLDLNMPVMDGWEFLEQFSSFYDNLESKPEIVLYILSSSIDSRDIVRSEKYDIVKGFIPKPLNGDNIENLKHNFR